MTEEPFHTITRSDVWTIITRIDATVTAIEEGQRLQNGRLGDHDDTLRTHASRIRSLDFKFYGVVAGLVAALAYIVSGG